MRTLDLFAGVGGIRLGFEKAGFETVFANDVDAKCKETYDLNFEKTKLTVADIWELDISELPEFDLLLGGFPCQAFSIAGYRKGFKDEEKGNLFFRIADILEERRPPVVFLENVKNLKNHDRGNTFRIIRNTLEDMGYYVSSAVLNTITHGNLPQNRERIFIVCFLDSKKANAFQFPEKIPLTVSFRDLLSDNVDDKYYYNNTALYEKLKDEDISEKTVYQWRRKYVRANKKGVCPTLTANMGSGGHNVPIVKNSKGIRKLTPKECFLFQGFPKSFRLPENVADSHLYHQAGNSVSVPVIARIAENIKNTMENKIEKRKDNLLCYLD